MPRLKIFPLFVLCALLCACQMDLRTGGTKADVTPLKSGPAVDRGKKLFVAMPADFTKGQDTEKSSGEDTQQALRKELEGASVQAVYAPAPQGMQQALAASRNAQCAYLIDLSILDWDDPPASFQLRPDKGEISLSVYDASSGELLRNDEVSCSGYATVVNSVGFYSPKDCLKQAFRKWTAEALTPN